jgi:intergrase/recombinase
MARRTEMEGLPKVHDGLLKILHPSQMLKAGGHSGGEVVERSRAIWMPRWTKSETVIEVCDGLLKILPLSRLRKSVPKSYRQLVQHITSFEIIRRRAQLKILSMVCNGAVQPEDLVAVWYLLHSCELAPMYTLPVNLSP